MRLDHLEYFIEVAQCQSINKAAKNLYISQPNLSQAIAALEAEIGSPLLKRSRQGVILTLEGAQVYRDSLQLLETVRHLVSQWQAAAADNRSYQGKVGIITIPGAVAMLSSHVLMELKQTCPGIDIAIYEEHLVNNFELLSNCKASIGLVYTLPHDPDFFESLLDNWVVIPMMEEEIHLFISPRHPLAKKERLDAEDLKQLHLADYCYLDGDYESRYCKLFAPRPYTRLNRRELIMQLVAENRAVALSPPQITQFEAYRKSGQIVTIPLEPGLGVANVVHFLAYKKGATPTELRVVDQLRYCFETYVISNQNPD